jgi:4-amino-4-deoxy-L-arabinose transferase-like glycosyltransferase
MNIRKKYAYVLIVIVFASLLYLPGLGKRDLWTPNEPNFGESAREMMDKDNYLFPTRNGEPLGMKPAPFYWLIIASTKLTGGLNETAARLPSAVFGILLVLLTFLFARRIMDEEGALFSSLILATAFKIAWQSRWVEADIVFSFFITLSLFFFFMGMNREERSRAFYLLGYAAAAVATLMKGVAGCVVVAVVILSYLVATKNLKKLLKMELILGPIVFFAIALPWYLLAKSYAGNEYMHELVINQNFIRFFHAFNHERPFYYFFGVLMTDFAPYSLFVPGAIVYAFITRKQLPEGKLSFFLTWVISIFIFFSLSDSKRSPYIIPLYPAAAILTGWLISSWIKQKNLRWFWADLPAWIIAVALGVVGLASIVFLANPLGLFGEVYAELLGYGFDAKKIATLVLPVVSLFVLGSGLMVFFLSTKRNRLYTITLIVFMGILMLYTQLSILNAANPLKSPRMISEEISSYLGPDDGFAAYSSAGDYLWDGYLYYSKRYIDLLDKSDELKDYYGQERRVIVIMRDRDFKKLPDDIKAELKTVKPFTVGEKEMVMTSNDVLEK